MAAHRAQCYMTLVMSDSYLPGAMVLAHSLRDAGVTRDLVALVTLETLTHETIVELRTLYHVIPVDRIPNTKPANLFLMGRPDLLYAFTKLALWKQTQYSKVVYIDADIVALRNLDDLFDINADFAAAPDIGWPDAFNSGLMVLKPDMGVYWALQALARTGDSFDGADQGLLNQYYEHRPWQRISFTYNCTPSAEYQWEPAYRYHKSSIKAVHFIGKDKPWFVGRQAGTGVGTYGELVGKWWSVYDRHYRQNQAYIPGKSYSRSTTVQQLVFGEHVDMYYGVPEHERLPPVASTDVAPHIQPQEQPPQEQTRPETIPAPPPVPVTDSSRHETGQPSQEQPKEWRAPPMPWDATRSAPPVHSQPEAANFATGHYTFEGEQREFQPPKAYPEPPKDMWYKVPEAKPTALPAPIFPWEKQVTRAVATRKFVDDLPASPQPSVSSPREAEWAASSGGMEKYIRQIMEQAVSKIKAPEVTSPTGRRESLIFTGIPAMQDRPSLPVTPAPERVNTFWGEDDGAGLSPEATAEPLIWVCPKCGFTPDSCDAFVSLPVTSHHTSLPGQPETKADSPPAVAKPLDSMARPRLEKRDLSSGTSTVSSEATIIASPARTRPVTDVTYVSIADQAATARYDGSLPPHLRPVQRDLLQALSVDKMETEMPSTANSKEESVQAASTSPAAVAVQPVTIDPLISAPPKLLPPPAWLTASLN